METATTPQTTSLIERMKGILQWFPAIYACMSLIGFIDYYTRYAPFNINIGEFLSAGEMLMAFIPRFMETLFQMALGFAFILIITPKLVRAIRVQVVNAEPRFTTLRKIAARKNRGSTRFTRWLSRTWFAMKWTALNVGTNVFLLLVLFLLPSITTRDTHQKIPLYVVGIILLAWFSVYFVQMAKLVRLKLVSAYGFLVLMIGTALCMYVVKIAVKNRYRGDEVRAHPERQQWEVITSVDTLRSGDSLVFAGRIEAGVFLYNVHKKLPVLIPTSEIQRLSFAESLVHSKETIFDRLLAP